MDGSSMVEVAKIALPPLRHTEKRFRNRPGELKVTKQPTQTTTTTTTTTTSNALHQSILDGRLNSLDYFLKMGFRPDMRDKYGRTGLMLACLSDHALYGVQVAKLLVQYGADINLQDGLGRTAMCIAVSEHRERLFDYFMDKHAGSIDFRLKDNDGNVLLNHVAAWGDTRMLRKVVDAMRAKGLAMDQRNNSGQTALLLAIRNDRFLNAFTLVKYGECSTTIKDNEKRLNAIEWLLTRIEANKDVLLNVKSRDEGVLSNSDGLMAHGQTPPQRNGSIFSTHSSSVDSFASHHSTKRHKHPKTELLKLPHLTTTAPSRINPKPKATNQYFAIEDYCGHVPKTNPCVDHHGSHFMPLAPILKRTTTTTTTTDHKDHNARKQQQQQPTPDAKLHSNPNLGESFVIEPPPNSEPTSALEAPPTSTQVVVDKPKAASTKHSDAIDLDLESMGLKEVVKKLYDTLFDRMLEVNKPKRVVINVASEPTVAVASTLERSPSEAKKVKGKKKAALAAATTTNAAAEANGGESRPSIAPDLTKHANSFVSSSSKIELSLDKEIFEMEKMRQTPKLLALQRRAYRNVPPLKSVKESIHGLFSMYDTNLLLGSSSSSSSSRALHKDSFQTNWSDLNNDGGAEQSASRIYNNRSTVSITNRDKSSVML